METSDNKQVKVNVTRIQHNLTSTEVPVIVATAGLPPSAKSTDSLDLVINETMSSGVLLGCKLTTIVRDDLLWNTKH